ncbi:MAG: hypothetical protein U0746_06665 [Gemmataceae bacterium]
MAFLRLRLTAWTILVGSSLVGAAAAQVPGGDDAVFTIPESIAKAFREASLAKPDPTDDELTKLRKDRYRIASDIVRARLDLFTAGSRAGSIDALIESLKQLAKARLALTDKLDEQIKVHEQLIEVLKFVEEVNRRRFESGQAASQDYQQTQYEHTDAKIKLLELKAKVAAPTSAVPPNATPYPSVVEYVAPEVRCCPPTLRRR